MPYKLGHSGFYGWSGKGPDHSPGNKKSVFSYTDSCLRRLRNAELAVMGRAEAIGKRTVLITLTFPQEFSNDHRWRVNDRIRKLIRMVIKDGGLWCVEAHTGKKYIDRNGKEVHHPEMRGMVHFHYRVITSKSYDELLEWIVSQQNKDGVFRNSYDISERYQSLYQSIYQGKADQKNLIQHSGKIYGCWGVDVKGMSVDQGQIDLFGYEFVGKMMKSKLSDANVVVQKSKLGPSK